MYKTDAGKRLGDQTTNIRPESGQMLNYMKGKQKGAEQTTVTERELSFTARPSTHPRQIGEVPV